MITPQPGQPGTIGQQHGLQRLTETLAALETGQRHQETRDSEIRTQLATLSQELPRLRKDLRATVWAVAGLIVLTLTLAGLVGWQVWHLPEMVYARALGSLDATLAQQWGSLPKGVQEQLTTTYTRLGLVPPSQRK